MKLISIKVSKIYKSETSNKYYLILSKDKNVKWFRWPLSGTGKWDNIAGADFLIVKTDITEDKMIDCIRNIFHD
jgi:hypothetical protein